MHNSIAGLSIGSNFLSEKAARDGAEQGAMTNALRLTSVLAHITIFNSYISLLLYISGFQNVVCKSVASRWYANSFQGKKKNKKAHRIYIPGFNSQYQTLIMERFIQVVDFRRLRTTLPWRPIF